MVDRSSGLWGHMRKREGGKERVPTVEPSASGESTSALAVASAERKSANKRTDETRAIYKSVQSFSLSSHATSFSVLENIGE